MARNERKLELQSCIETAIKTLLDSPRGVNAFGKCPQCYVAKNVTGVIVVRTTEGECYLVKVQKSGITDLARVEQRRET